MLDPNHPHDRSETDSKGQLNELIPGGVTFCDRHKCQKWLHIRVLLVQTLFLFLFGIRMDQLSV